MQQGGAVEAAFAPKGNTQLIPNSYQISKGSLALVPALVPKTTAEGGASFGANAYASIGVVANIPNGTYSGLDMWRLLFGIMPGDQLTFPQIYGEGIAQGLVGAGGIYLDKTLYTDFVAPRIVFKESDSSSVELNSNTQTSAITAALIAAIDAENTWFDPVDVVDAFTIGYETESTDAWTFSMSGSYDSVFAINNDDPLRAIGCIRSHKDVSSRQWQYSTSDLVCIWQDGDRGIGDLNYFGFTLANAIDTYKKNIILDSDGNFLQRGTDDNIVPQSFQ